MSSHPSAWSAQALRQEIWELLQCVSLPHLAWRSRRAYLPFGIEHRSPLWDLRVIEFYLRTPVWVHEDAGRTKAILRSVMQDKVPASVFQRDDKALFDTRLRYGLVDAEAQRVDEALLRSSLADLPFVKQAELEEELRLYQSRDHPWWLPLWRAITSGLWLQFGVPSGASTQAGYSQEIGALH